MNPYFFGSSQKSLFGAHHPPKARTAREAGVVLCAPMGHEYMRTHKALRQLAMQLAKGGFHVLRFDYFGTGDSSGDGTEGGIDQWLDDIGLAADEIKETGGVSKVVLVGLRLGATLAATVAARRSDVDGLVLWDPIVSGPAYLEELLRPRGGEASRASVQADSGPHGVRGFPFTDAMVEGLRGLDLMAAQARIPVRRLLLVVSEEREQHGRLRDHLAGTVYRYIPSMASWDNVDEFGAMVLPQKIIQGITEYLTVEARP